MIISVWRYSHFCLAVSSFLLLTLASLTGIVLAFEPIAENAKGFKVEHFDTITVAHTVPLLKEKLHGLQELSVNDYGFVIAKYTGEDKQDKTVYVNPNNGAILGEPHKQKPFFEWATTLHRSLFMHETGRLIVGIVAFLLILIALSGIGLIIQRQKGIRRFFASIEKTSFAQYYHTVLGRLSLVFILAIAVTGTYMSVSRFILKPAKVSVKVDDSKIKEDPQIALKDFPIFQKTKLEDVQTIQFPFSNFPEDYYTIKLKDRELCVNQFTGEILAQQAYSKSYTLTNLSLQWHTGRSSVVWAVVLAITSGYILFFIYSGLFISWKRVKSKSKNKYKAKDCRTIILVGSENGSTFRFASTIYKQLVKHGEKAFLADLDTYTLYPNAEQLIIMTSTYGEGDPPSNAKKFLELLVKNPQQQTIRFSVVGFGSRSYQHFCKFGQDVDTALRQQAWTQPLIAFATVDEKSPQDFSAWLDQYTQAAGTHLTLSQELLSSHLQGLQTIKVLEKSKLDTGNVFLLRMQSKHFRQIASGDLLAVYPKNDHRERLYSIGKVNGSLQLSIKLHEHGLGSNYLQALNIGEKIKVRIVKNLHFHFPKRTMQVAMISNGTGIAPFLGMLAENKNKVDCKLYCGFRTNASAQLYRSILGDSNYQIALSREGEQLYVSHLVEREHNYFAELLKNKGVIMICGSLSMQKDVFAILEKICSENRLPALETFQENGQILTDCY